MTEKRSGRWWRRLFGGSAPTPLDPSRADLVVVASCFDDVEACSVTLDRAASTTPPWRSEEQAVLRHHLLLPGEHVTDAIAVAGQDDYVEATAGPLADTPPVAPGHGENLTVLILQRVQVLDALHCSQERSRMAGLAQRRGGRVLGWDALQPDPAAAESS